MKKRRKKSPAGIYAFALVWLVCGFTMPLYRLGGLLVALGLSVAVGVLVGNLVNKSGKQSQVEQAAAAPEQPKDEAKPETSYGPEVDAIVADGRKAMKEMGRLYASIKDPDVKVKINELMRISDKIVQDAIQDPSDVPQIRKFLNYYLPTTIKLLNAYDRMSDQGIEGENLSKSMKSIYDMLDTSIDAFKKQLDSLFENQALDIETDISVMNRMLAREGLSGGGELDELIEKHANAQESGQSVAAAQTDEKKGN